MAVFTLCVCSLTLAEPDVCRCQILTTRVYARTVRVKMFIMAVDSQPRYSNESERADSDIFDDFKLKNPLVSMVYTSVFLRFKG